MAHEALQATADKVPGSDILPHCGRIDAWAECYQAAGWPEATPGYLLGDYSGLPTGLRDQQRLARLACDSERHHEMAGHARSDFAALTEITVAPCKV